MKIVRLNRYTTLPILLDYLERRKLVLLNPKTWDDRNDSLLIETYRSEKKIKRLLAICFSHGSETIHHWKTFADGVSGCCIQFTAEPLLARFDELKLRHGMVHYKKLNEIKSDSMDVDKIPFTKRWPYRCEEEYRAILEDDESYPTFEIDFELSWIEKITISQGMPGPVFKTIKSLLNDTNNPERRIHHSTLYENKDWLGKFKTKYF